MGLQATDPKLRAWFLRNLLEAAEREFGPATVAQLPERVPTRVRAHVSLDRLRATAALDTIPLAEAEDALLALDQALGDGAGRGLERAACEMLAKQLVQAASAVRVGDLYGTMARLRAPIEHPFVDVDIQFELARAPTGLRLTLGVPGRPRATRSLAHIAVGAIHAAERFARESHAEPLRVKLESIADRATIDAHFRRASTVPPPIEPVPASRRPTTTSRVFPSLSDEVARILDSSRSLERPRASEEPPRRPSSDDALARAADNEPKSVRPAGEVASPSRPAPEPESPAAPVPRSTRPPPAR